MENINGKVNPRTHTISIQGMSYGMTIENIPTYQLCDLKSQKSTPINSIIDSYL